MKTKSGFSIPLIPGMLKDEFGVYEPLNHFTKYEIEEIIKSWGECLLRAWFDAGGGEDKNPKKYREDYFNNKVIPN